VAGRTSYDPAHKNPVVVPVSLFFVRYLGYSGLKGHKTVVTVMVNYNTEITFTHITLQYYNT